MKKIIILGSTGSIGTQTLDVIRKYKEDFEVIGIACNSNIDLLIKQIIEFKPKYVAIKDSSKAYLLKEYNVEVFFGENSCNELAKIDCDLLLNSLVGVSGLLPTLTALTHTDVALANKETLVSGGEIVKEYLNKYNHKLFPVDSEHSAIWQCLDFNVNKKYNKILLTASGGAFRDLTIEEITKAKACDALKHPTWNMGKKVTIDSATMMNKGLEVIEAMHLFNKSVDDIQVLIHKQSVVHSMIQYDDGSIIAQMSYPDMKLPIQVALFYPNRGNYTFSPLDFNNLNLNFIDVDYKRFPCLKIAKDVAKVGGLAPTIMNAANEILVESYLKDDISYFDIPYNIESALDKLYQAKNIVTCDSIIEIDSLTRQYVINNLSK